MSKVSEAAKRQLTEEGFQEALQTIEKYEEDGDITAEEAANMRTTINNLKGGSNIPILILLLILGKLCSAAELKVFTEIAEHIAKMKIAKGLAESLMKGTCSIEHITDTV